ncbi:phenylalanine--tRNA ligase subunit beta [Thermoleophilia bacterium SCSIO 60948]|nr:phenylalanine--tRNA ligase subunit beta [Thermoleophilia bacterium SCSIO 60948]
MRVPVSWLRELCDPGWSVGEIAERLALSGTEVERITTLGPDSGEGFVIGRVSAAEQHPNADRLRVCTVEIGTGEPATIVCGAPNVAAGQTVAVARPGAVMPDGTKLRRAKLRGVVSDGMICSAAELDLGSDHDGIMVIASGEEPAPQPGTPLEEVIALGETVLELEITPNRSDCFGVWGVARELHAISGAPLAEAPWTLDADPTGPPVEAVASVRVEDPDLCPRYTARAFEEVTIEPSPRWLQQRLIAAGQRPISNVVDITNYVMLLTAQPLHAFDLDRVPGGEVIVRRARDGETMTTLDGVERSFETDTLLIADRERATGIGGIMGGQISEVSGETTRVLLEAANFDAVNILRTSSRLALRSEASTRFEKGLHPEMAIRGQRVASRLFTELCGATLRAGTLDVLATPIEPRRLTLRPTRTDALLGQATAPAEQATRLEALGFDVEDPGSGVLEVAVPYERAPDITREVDLIEEVARIGGLSDLPATLPAGGRIGGLTREQSLRRRAEDVLRDEGMGEVKTWTFTSVGEGERLGLAPSDPRSAPVLVANPLSEEGAAMRTTLVSGLLGAAALNHARRAGHVALFESGRIYLRDGEPSVPGSPLAGDFGGVDAPPALEVHRLGGVLSGERSADWRGAGAAGDGFYELKGIVEQLAAALEAELRFAPTSDHAFLWPGRAASVALADGRVIGWLGELHPRVASAHDLPGGSAFELDAAPLLAAARTGVEVFEPVSAMPSLVEDLAVVVAEDVSAETVTGAVRAGGGELVAAVGIFDLYRGEQLGEGRKSLAVRVEFRSTERTLTDAEVAERRAAIESELAEIGGTLRA